MYNFIKCTESAQQEVATNIHFDLHQNNRSQREIIHKSKGLWCRVNEENMRTDFLSWKEAEYVTLIGFSVNNNNDSKCQDKSIAALNYLNFCVNKQSVDENQ